MTFESVSLSIYDYSYGLPQRIRSVVWRKLPSRCDVISNSFLDSEESPPKVRAYLDLRQPGGSGSGGVSSSDRGRWRAAVGAWCWRGTAKELEEWNVSVDDSCTLYWVCHGCCHHSQIPTVAKLSRNSQSTCYTLTWSSPWTDLLKFPYLVTPKQSKWVTLTTNKKEVGNPD